jgi:glycogen debranching enzyme
VAEREVSILDGNTFVTSDVCGDFEATPRVPTGFFSFDTRFLSTWILTLNGKRMLALSTDDLNYYESRFFLVPGPAHPIESTVSLIRHRWIGNGFQECVTVLNHDHAPVDLTLRLDVASDFADIIEVTNATKTPGRRYVRVDDGRLTLGYQRGNFRRESVISSSGPAQVDDGGFTFVIQIGPHQEWETSFRVQTNAPGPDGRDVRSGLQYIARSNERKQQDLQEWLAAAPVLECDWDALRTTYRRSMVDLEALRFTPFSAERQSMPAARLPWFMTILGRDSILSSLQALPFTAAYAATTLRLLAVLQGSRLDDFRDEEPGKILHKFRYGETAAFMEQPHSPYYGTADATPLWLVLLDEYQRWTGDDGLVRELEDSARAALAWIDTYANLRGDGYIRYQRRNLQTGLENQCWKNSWDGISCHDGRLPSLPRATCELQGYAYNAKVGAARLARQVWNDGPFADRLEHQAADLKERFNRDFWIEDRGYYALALDAYGGQVDALSSNIGHLLWSGIVDQARAQQVVDHLLGPRLFSGWGIRTLATDAARYNPIGFHTGSVWPFDNSFIAWGMRRYGFGTEAAKIADAMITAAEFFDGRLPEALAGYASARTKYPVHYPTACRLQAWSAGAPLLFIRTMLGLEPDGDRLVYDPVLPEKLGRIELLDIPGRWGRFDAFGRRPSGQDRGAVSYRRSS